MRGANVTSAVAIVLFSALGGSAVAQDARAAIDAVNKRFVAASNKGDAAAAAALYSSDGQAFPPNSPVVSGRAAIEKMWKGVFDSGITNVSLTTTEVEPHGDFAFESGSYELKFKDDKVADRGKYIVVWKRENGQWRLHRDIWNTIMPPGK